MVVRKFREYSSGDLHPFLERTQSGEVVISFQRTSVLLLLFLALFALAQVAMTYFIGLDFYMSKFAALALVCFIPLLVQFYYSLRTAQGKPLTQVSVRGIFFVVAYCCALAAAWSTAMQFERGYRNPTPELFESKIMQVVKEGSATFDRHRYLHLHVDRPSFDDEDVSTLMKLFEPSARRKYFLTLELGGTEVGDATVRMLANQDRLEVLNLRATNVSDESVKFLSRLRKLKVLDLRETSVTPECLAELKQALGTTDVYSGNE